MMLNKKVLFGVIVSAQLFYEGNSYAENPCNRIMEKHKDEKIEKIKFISQERTDIILYYYDWLEQVKLGMIISCLSPNSPRWLNYAETAFDVADKFELGKNLIKSKDTKTAIAGYAIKYGPGFLKLLIKEGQSWLASKAASNVCSIDKRIAATRLIRILQETAPQLPDKNLATLCIDGILDSEGDNGMTISTKNRVVDLLRIAEEKRKARDYVGAETALKEAYTLEPMNAQIKYGLGRALLGQEKLQEAEEQLLEAFRLAPEDKEICYMLGIVSIKQRKRQEGINYLNKYIDLHSDKQSPALEGVRQQILNLGGKPH